MNAVTETRTDAAKRASYDVRQILYQVERAAADIVDAIDAAKSEVLTAEQAGDHDGAVRLYRETVELRRTLDGIQNAVRNTRGTIDQKLLEATYAVDTAADYATHGFGEWK